jgi:hypothetical protein
MCISFRLVDQLSHVLCLSSLVILESYGFAIGANIAAPGFRTINHMSADQQWYLCTNNHVLKFRFFENTRKKSFWLK